MKRGSSGLAGGGIYFATTPELTGKARKKGEILEATVALGKMHTLDHNGDPTMTRQKLKSMGFDSVCIARAVSSGQEYVVYDPKQVKCIVRARATARAEKFLRIQRAFETFDTDGNGSLSIAELKAVLKRPGGGSPLTDEDVEEIIADYDVNRDGELQLNEFARMWGLFFEGEGEKFALPPQPRAAGMYANCHMPMNQGQAGTCVGYAFAAAVSQNLLAKYGVPVHAEKIADKVKTLCVCWDGHWPDKMCAEWNAKHKEPGSYLEDVDKSAQYSINVACEQLTDIEKTYEKMKHVQGTMTLICVIKTDAAGHSLHAVALTNAYRDKPNMYAINSWGASKALLDVTRENFHSAFVVMPGIVVVQKNHKKALVPPLQKGWIEKVDQEYESDSARLRQENAQLKQELNLLRRGQKLVKSLSKSLLGGGGKSLRTISKDERPPPPGLKLEVEAGPPSFEVLSAESQTDEGGCVLRGKAGAGPAFNIAAAGGTGVWTFKIIRTDGQSGVYAFVGVASESFSAAHGGAAYFFDLFDGSICSIKNAHETYSAGNRGKILLQTTDVLKGKTDGALIEMRVRDDGGKRYAAFRVNGGGWNEVVTDGLPAVVRPYARCHYTADRIRLEKAAAAKKAADEKAAAEKAAAEKAAAEKAAAEKAAAKKAADEKAAAEKAPPPPGLKLEGGSLSGLAAKYVGTYRLTSKLVNGRPTWQHTSNGERWIAFDGASWMGQPESVLGQQKGSVDLRDAAAASPDASTKTWTAKSVGGGSVWALAPELKCTAWTPPPAHVWMWETGAVGSGSWDLFDTASEETFRNQEASGVPRFRIEIRGQAYDVDLSLCTQQNVKTGFVRKLRRL